MIQPRSIVKICDNSGARIGRIFKVLGGSRRRYAQIGDRVVLSVQKADRRKAGSYIRFDENAVVILEKEKKEPIAGRVFGPIPREIADMGYQQIASLAPEVV